MILIVAKISLKIHKKLLTQQTKNSHKETSSGCANCHLQAISVSITDTHYAIMASRQ